MQNWRILALAGSLVCFIALSGCASDEGKLTPQEVKDFKGGPMPESARKIMAERMQAAAAKGGANLPGTTQPPGAPPANAGAAKTP